MLFGVAVISLISCSIYAVPIAEEYNSNRIVGGRPVDITEFPWQVSIYYGIINQHFCGGSIIGPSTILTAAHCVSPGQENYIRVRVGSTIRYRGGTTRAVRKIVTHEGFSQTTLDNDIALLFLWYPITFNQEISAVALPQPGQDLANNETVHVSGWGSRNVQSETTLPYVLQAVSIQIVDQESCARAYSDLEDLDARVTDNMFCAGVENVGGKDSCQGDSGGPVVHSTGDDAVIHGIVSWGYGCALPTHPGVYTRVTRYIDWINNQY